MKVMIVLKNVLMKIINRQSRKSVGVVVINPFGGKIHISRNKI